MKYFFILVCCLSFCNLKGQITGKVVDERDNNPIVGATVMLLNSNVHGATDSMGVFLFEDVFGVDSLIIYSFGYDRWSAVVTSPFNDIIRLTKEDRVIDPVIVNTGYYQIPKERSTGSFVMVDAETFNRSVSPNIVERLEGVVPGLVFDKRSVAPEQASSRTSLRIRGESSIYTTNEPLIILDNFPYEGDLSAINPDIIENITVLRDAAAASIWGAKAGNGVIVINTKKGRVNENIRLTWNSNLSLTTEPDLYSNPNFLKSSYYMEAENFFFENGLYTPKENNTNKPPLSPYVELLIARRDNIISQSEFEVAVKELESTDIRTESLKHLYRPSATQRHALTIQGGMKNYTYAFNVGYQNELQQIDRNDWKRFNINANNSFKVKEWLKFSVNLSFAKSNERMDGLGMIALNAYPYSRLMEQDGTASPFFNTYRKDFIETPPDIISKDWYYRPLEDLNRNSNHTVGQDIRLFGEAQADILKDKLSLNVKYQYRNSSNLQELVNDKESFYIRNLINRYTQQDGYSAFPEGGQYRRTGNGIIEHNARLQLDYRRSWTDHEAFFIGGAEIRETKGLRDINTLYAYDPEFLTTNSKIDYFTRYSVLPRGTALLPVPLNSLSESTDRFLSYFVNGSYSFLQKYTLSGSLRTDASNIFGVKTNQKWVPLWSTGILWRIDKESFFTKGLFSKLSLRATYGFNGNVNKSVSAYITANYLTSGFTGLRYADIRTPGNPQMRWEKVAIKNFGIDFASVSNRVAGSLDLYIKDGNDLFGDIYLDPTNGIAANSLLRNQVNYASTRTKGFDFEVQTLNTIRKLKWTTNFYVSYAQDKVKSYDESIPVLGYNYFSVRIPPKVGISMNTLYTYPVLSLDPETGDPLVAIDGELSKDYGKFYQATAIEDLVNHGSRIPKYTGAIRNSIAFKHYTLSANVVWKAGYYFMASSIDYSRLFANTHMHRDFEDRWMKPGDEKWTNVPSQPNVLDPYRDEVYLYSASLVEKGDHIRLKDISFSYQTKKGLWGMQQASIYFIADNLGVLYRANKRNIDPDYRLNTYSYRPPKIYSLGIKAIF